MSDERFVTPAPLPNDHERELLIIFIEECSEAQKRATKLLRFGRDEVEPGQSYTNSTRLALEIGDVTVMIETLLSIKLIRSSDIKEGCRRKRRKLPIYMQTSRAPNLPAALAKAVEPRMSETTAHVDCPALHIRRIDQGYPFGDRVPKTVRLKTTVTTDAILRFANPDCMRVAPSGFSYPAWTNSYGAVSAVFPDGSKLGLKPHEFDVVDWHG